MHKFHLKDTNFTHRIKHQNQNVTWYGHLQGTSTTNTCYCQLWWLL